ncbi:NAD-dependent epimerase, partial [Pseudomonas aeruginosa]
MRNLETATLKLGIFHPHDSLSQALIAAALQRQIEVSALQADLNSLQARPGLRCKPASLASSIEVSQAAAGLDLLFAPLSDYAAEALPPICAALIDGALRAEVPRLFLLGHWQWLVAPRDAGEEQLGAGLERSLTVSGLDWTLVEVPSLPAGLRIDDFSRAGDVAEVEAARVFACAEA